jgi:hypothetical protein
MIGMDTTKVFIISIGEDDYVEVGLMNRSKLFEWLLDNDCPWEWETSDEFSVSDNVTLTFYEKEEDEV